MWEAINQLAEAQRKTEARVNELAEAQKRTEERLNAFEKATEENFKRVWEAINQLAEAQRRTEERLNALAQRVEELAEAQRKTEARVNELAEAQRRTEERLDAFEKATEENFKRVWEAINQLAEAQRRTEERVNELAEAQKRTEERLESLAKRVEQLTEEVRAIVGEIRDLKKRFGDLSDAVGFGLEDRAFKSLPKLLKRDYGIEVEGRLLRRFVKDAKGRDIEVNIFGKGTKDGVQITIIGECKSQLSKNNVISFIEDRLARFEGVYENIFPVIVTYMISEPDVEDFVREKGIALYYSYDFD
ncbi:hypothetical protein JGI13_01963 [Candidatus Kryptonium thompsonii]|nr:hypothetical protein JGI13_01963 [Candidatus Kryptonium thompsoni]